MTPFASYCVCFPCTRPTRFAHQLEDHHRVDRHRVRYVLGRDWVGEARVNVHGGDARLGPTIRVPASRRAPSSLRERSLKSPAQLEAPSAARSPQRVLESARQRSQAAMRGSRSLEWLLRLSLLLLLLRQRVTKHLRGSRVRWSADTQIEERGRLIFLASKRFSETSLLFV